MKNYFKQSNPFKVPTNDNKLIEEHFGIVANGEKNYSIAHMVAPPKWIEPQQNPEFDEITIMIRGAKKIIIDDEEIFLKKGESLFVKKGSRVQYSNPFDEEAEYWSICLPAFTIEKANRK
ncbi:MAG: cupin domain-containing protein [Bacteroidetes bacterium]|nr:cupin domain-containing protein [Bacteroidota bacterium]